MDEQINRLMAHGKKGEDLILRHPGPLKRYYMYKNNIAIESKKSNDIKIIKFIKEVLNGI